MIGWEYPPHNSGGLGVACEGLTKSLAGMQTSIYFTLPYRLPLSPGHMSVVSCLDPSWDQIATSAPFSVYSSVPIFKPGVEKLSANDLAALPQSELEVKVSQYANIVAKQGKSHQNDFDVIHAHDWMSFPAAIELKQQTGKPFVAHVHSTELDRIPNGYGSQYITHIEHEGMLQAEAVIAVSHYTKSLLVHRYGIPAEKIQVVHNGIEPLNSTPDVGTHHFAPDRKVVVFMGRLTGQKGPEYFLHLAQAVQKRNPDVLFVVAGDGDMYRHLLVTTAKNQLSGTVIYSGFVRGNQQATLFNRADVFVMPSLSEPFGLVALEAAQRHTPVILSKQSGVSEVMPHAIALDFWDINAMTNTVCTLLDHPEDRDKMIAGQLGDVSKVTWSAAAEKVKNVYGQFLE